MYVLINLCLLNEAAVHGRFPGLERDSGKEHLLVYQSNRSQKKEDLCYTHIRATGLEFTPVGVLGSVSLSLRDLQSLGIIALLK